MTTPAPTSTLQGVAGTLAGTNPLQQSVDSLTNAVQSLTTQLMASAPSFNNQTAATRQQTPGQTTTTFPAMQNPFQTTTTQAGIGGGGRRGAGNISPTATFGAMGAMAAFTGTAINYGQSQLAPQLALNQAATMALPNMNTNGMSRGQAMQQYYNLVGATPGSTMSMGTGGVQGNIALNQNLAMLSGNMNLQATALGRAGYGAAAAFNIANPSMGAGTLGQMAAGLYSPQTALIMRQLGVGSIRGQGGSAIGMGQYVQNIMRRLGETGMSGQKLFGNLASPNIQSSLSAMLSASGVSNQAMMSTIQDYATLFSKGYTASSATNLMTRASGGPGVSRQQQQQARQTLSKMNIATATNDVSAMAVAQGQVTGRLGDTAQGFDAGLQTATQYLGNFNQTLNALLKGPLGGMVGFGGGAASMLSGGLSTAGNIGGLLAIGKFLKGGGGAARGGASGFESLFGNTAGASAGAAGGGMSVAAIGTAIGGAAGLAMVDVFSAKVGKSLGINVAQKVTNKIPVVGHGVLTGIEHMGQQIPVLGPIISALTGHTASIGGGAASVAQTAQKTTGGNTQKASVSGSARKAVSSAETQIGVPYVYGDEAPGVGFDCSGLVQWAYKQAGVNLPRTSQEMWNALSKRRIAKNAVQEGDLVFAGGSDGSASSPGHVGLMISSKELIQAPYTGSSVQNIAYDPNSWVGAARPSGSGTFGGSVSSGPSIGGTSSSGANVGVSGNRGASTGIGGSYGSVEEASILNSLGYGYGGSGGGGAGLTGGAANGTSGSGNTVTSNTGKTGSVAGITGGGNVTANKKLMQQMAQAMYRWGSGGQWSALDSLEMSEAGYRNTAQNPTSTAYGMGQFLDSTWAGYGPKTANPKLQIQYMLEYIKQRYGTPEKAWAFHQANNYYGAGGMLEPGMSIVGDRGPEVALNSGGKTQILSNPQTSALINAIKGNVPQNPWKTDITSGSQGHATVSTPTINFNRGAIMIQGTGGGQTDQIASKAAREVARQVVKHINKEYVHSAIRGGSKL